MTPTDRIYPGILAALPDIRLGANEPVRVVNLAHAFHYLLHPDDRDLLQLAYLPIDHENLLYLLFDQKRFVAGGNFNEDELARLARGESCPYPYLSSFLDDLPQNRWSPAEADRALHIAYLDHLLSGPSPLLAGWARQSVQMRLFLWTTNDPPLWLQADLDRLATLVGEDWPPMPDEWTRGMRTDDLWEREKLMDQWLWDGLEQGIRFQPYSVDALVSYALRSILASRWTAFQVTPGADRLHHLITTIMEH